MFGNLFNCSPRALHPSVMSSSRVKWSRVIYKLIEWIMIFYLLFHVHCTTLKFSHFCRSLASWRTSSAVEHSTVSKLGHKNDTRKFSCTPDYFEYFNPPKSDDKYKKYRQHFHFIQIKTSSCWASLFDELHVKRTCQSYRCQPWLKFFFIDIMISVKPTIIQGKHKNRVKTYLL